MPVATKLAHQHQAMLLNQRAKHISRKALFSKEGGLGASSFSEISHSPMTQRGKDMRKIPVTIQTISRSISSVKGLRGLGEDNYSLVTEAESTPSVVETEEEYVVTTDVPAIPQEEAVVLEQFAAESTSATAPSSDLVDSVLQTFQAETLKSITDNIVTNSDLICNNAAVFFKNVFLTGCDVKLVIDASLGMAFDVSVLIDTNQLTTGKLQSVSTSDNQGIIVSNVGEILINSNEFATARRNIRTVNKGAGVSVTFDLVEHPSIATGIDLNDPTTPLVKSLCESLLVAVGASILGQEFSVFGQSAFSASSPAGMAYRQSVFSGAMAISLLNRNPEAKNIVQDLVKTFSKCISEVLACPAELSSSLESVYSSELSSVDVAREAVAVEDTELLLMYGTDDVAFSISNSQALQLTQDIIEAFVETLESDIPSLMFSQLKIQALDVENATVSLVNAFSAALDSLKVLASILPSNLLDAPVKLEEAQADISRNVFELKEVEDDSDLLTQEYMLYVSSPISYMSDYLDSAVSLSNKDEMAGIVIDLFEQEVGENIYDSYEANPTNVGVLLESDKFNLAVEEAVVQRLKGYVSETDTIVETIKESAGVAGNTLKSLLTMWAQPLASAVSPDLKAKIEGFVNQHGPQVQSSLQRTVDSAAAHVDTTKENVSIAINAANRKKKVVALSSLGMGSKVAIGAVLGAVLYFGAKYIIKRK